MRCQEVLMLQSYLRVNNTNFSNKQKDSSVRHNGIKYAVDQHMNIPIACRVTIEFPYGRKCLLALPKSHSNVGGILRRRSLFLR